MSKDEIVLLVELLGVVAFAASGAMVGIKKKMDLFGVVVLGITCSVAGGIIRDIILGKIPPVAFERPIYTIVATIVSIIVFLPPIRKHVNTDKSFLLVFDSIGLGLFTVIGAQSGASLGNGFLMVFLGVLTGCGGGVLRDLFAGEIPMIFVRHFYACASIIGAICYVILIKFIDETVAMIVAAAIVVTLRLLAAKYKWHMPKA